MSKESLDRAFVLKPYQGLILSVDHGDENRTDESYFLTPLPEGAVLDRKLRETEQLLSGIGTGFAILIPRRESPSSSAVTKAAHSTTTRLFVAPTEEGGSECQPMNEARGLVFLFLELLSRLCFGNSLELT